MFRWRNPACVCRSRWRTCHSLPSGVFCRNHFVSLSCSTSDMWRFSLMQCPNIKVQSFVVQTELEHVGFRVLEFIWLHQIKIQSADFSSDKNRVRFSWGLLKTVIICWTSKNKPGRQSSRSQGLRGTLNWSHRCCRNAGHPQFTVGSTVQVMWPNLLQGGKKRGETMDKQGL